MSGGGLGVGCVVVPLAVKLQAWGADGVDCNASRRPRLAGDGEGEEAAAASKYM